MASLLVWVNYNFKVTEVARNESTANNEEIADNNAVEEDLGKKIIKDKIEVEVSKDERGLVDDIEITMEKGESKTITMQDYSEDESVQSSGEEWTFQY